MVDNNTTAVVFPGQGSQTVGMGKDLVDAYPIAKETFDEADAIMGVALSEMMFDDPDGTLGETMYTQPALYVHSIALWRCLQAERPDVEFVFTAGHSLGEFTALTVADALAFDDGLKLVRERGRLMQAAGESNPGAMAALLGITVEDAQRLCDDCGSDDKPLVIANDNCPGQVVISGDGDSLQAAVEVAKDYGAKRIIPLDVSVATHSPLMQPAADPFAELVRSTPFSAPRLPVYGNVSAQPLTTAEDIRAELEAQLTSTVRWRESINQMIAAGATQFIEMGSKNVLTGLLRRIDRAKEGISVQDKETLHAYLQSLGTNND